MSTLKTLTKAELITLVQQRNAVVEQLRMDLSIAKSLAAQPVAPKPVVAQPNVAKTFWSGGKLWAKVRVGFNQFAIREVAA